jgi:hypothetical protein
MRVRRRVATPEADGGAQGPAHGSSSVKSARIVRDDEVQPTTSDRGLRSSRADLAPQLAFDAGGRHHRRLRRRRCDPGVGYDRRTDYARVSSGAQARENPIASQLTSLRERVAADSLMLEPDDCYVDEGFSGSTLYARCSSDFVMQPLAAGSSACMSMPLITWLGATPIKRCSSTSFGAPAWR